MVEFYLKVLGQKNSSLASGNRPDKNFLSLTRPFNQMCIRICIFNFKKQQTNKKEQELKKAKETKEKKRISQENRLKK